MKKSNIFTLLIVLLFVVSGLIYNRVYKLEVSFKQYKIENNKFRVQKIDKLVAITESISYLIGFDPSEVETLEQLDFINDKVIAKGRNTAKKHKAVFVGIARDNAAEIIPVIRHIQHAGEYFKDYRVIVFENDSMDNTKFILKFWASINPKVQIISEDFHNKKRPSIKFLADARNRYLDALSSKDYDQFDIVIPIDMDMKYGFDIRGILHSFSQIDRWDVVCSNGIFTSEGHMYDAFAFRDKNFPDAPHEFKGDYWSEKHMKEMQKVYASGSDLVPVYSCFGGLGIYKRKYMDGCQYDSEEGDCEHVYLHECMRKKNNARIFMNPNQIIRYSHYK